MEPEHKPFSYIKFSQQLEKQIGKINTFPLNADNFVIQQDVYKRLGSLSDDEAIDEEEAFAIFATLDCSRKESDTHMRFAIELSSAGFLLSIEGVGGMFIGYDPFKDEADAVRQVVAMLKMLANGQLACLLTTRHGIVCCSEFLIYEKASRKPLVLATDGNYKRRWRKDDETGYDVEVLRNNYINEQVSIPKDFFLIDKNSEGKPAIKGRDLKENELTPLTKRQYDYVLTQVGGELIGKKKGEEDEDVLARHWEFWAITVLVGATIITASVKGWLPAFIANTVVIPVIVGLFASGVVTTLIIMKKVQLEASNPNHPWLRFDALVKNNWLHLFASLIPIFQLVATTFPCFISLETGKVVNLYQLALETPIAWGVLPLFFIALLATFKRSTKAAVGYFLSILAGSAAIIAVNELYTNTAIEATEPYQTIAGIGYYLAPFISIAFAIAMFRRYRKPKPTDEDLNVSNKTVGAEVVEKYRKRLNIASKIQLISSMAGSAGLVAAAVIFGLTLPDSSVATGDNLHVVLVVNLAAALVGIAGFLLYTKKVPAAWIGRSAWAVSGGTLVAILQLIKEGSDDGSEIAWVMMFAGLFLFAVPSYIRDALDVKVRQEGVKQEVFTDKE